jgi:serine O-acetyltransferase
MTPVIEYILSDLHRYEGSTSASALLRHLLFNWSFRYSFWLRLCGSQSGIVRFVAKVMHRHLSIKFGVHIPASTRIGHGLYIGHPVGLVINHTARIGNNCNLSQFTTIGSNYEHAASIGDNVYIGPGACIVEDVVIGNNATIGAGSVVISDVPENATAAGNPARVVSMNVPGRYVGNRWPGIAPEPANTACPELVGRSCAVMIAPSITAIPGNVESAAPAAGQWPEPVPGDVAHDEETEVGFSYRVHQERPLSIRR